MSERQPLLERHDAAPEPALERNFSFLAALGLAFTLLNTWTAMAAALPVGLQSGGPVVMLYGLLLSVAGQTFVALSLAEICHVLPMAGGQYDWAYLLAPPKWRRPLSWVVGWLACAGWVTLFAAAAALTESLFMGVLVLWSDTLPARWGEFALIISFVMASFLLNAFCVRWLPALDWFSGVWSVAGMALIMGVLLFCSRGAYQLPKTVFTTFTNNTGVSTRASS
jgi:amino acid transporter